jgi:F-type H+-transporting ATPase subunit epsilon
MLKLEIVTPEKKVFDDSVDSVTVPTASGDAGILPNHAPLISALKPGILSYSNKGTTGQMVVSGGFIEVSNNSVSVLTDTAETADEIDVEAARVERDAAEKRMREFALAPVEEADATRERMERENARIQLASGK